MMARSRGMVLLAFAAAFLAGLATAWAVMASSAASAFAFEDRSTVLKAALSPLAGIAVFQLVFGLATRLWRGPLFWLYAPIVVYGMGALALWALLTGYVTFVEALALYVVAVAAIGIWRAIASSRVNGGTG